MDTDWSGFYCGSRKVILINLINLKLDSKWLFHRYGGPTLTTETDQKVISVVKNEEESWEQLAFISICHELQHHVQCKQNRLNEPLEQLELEAEVIGSKCLLSFKKSGNLNEVKKMLTA